MPLPLALAAAAPGLLKAGASLFGGGKRRRAEQQAQEAFNQQKQALDSFQFENPYANQENVFEDATVNTQAANFQAQQADASLANIVDSAQQSGGPVDYTALAGQALGAKQAASADIARQEQANQQAALGEQSRLNQQAAQGAATLQNQQHGQLQQQFNLAQQDLSQAQAARQQARQDLVGGLASAAGSAFETHAQLQNSPTPRLKNSALKRLYSPLKQDPTRKAKTYADLAGTEQFDARRGAIDALIEGGSFSETGSKGGVRTLRDRSGNVVRVNRRGQLVSQSGRPLPETDAAYKPFEDAIQGNINKGFTDAFNKENVELGLDTADNIRSRELEQTRGSIARQHTLEKANREGRDVSASDIAEIGREADLAHREALIDYDDKRGIQDLGKDTVPLQRISSPLYRMFKMKWKGMYK